jgi:D-glycero-D-manno-heptose 1,7-bisphosphate phosphatase
MKRAVFLDRDGVLNEAVVVDGQPKAPLTAAEVVIPPDAAASLEAMHDAGFLLIVVTNQPDIVRGRMTWENLHAVNSRLRDVLPLDDIRVCAHDDRHGCECRKPLPGLLTSAARDHGIDLVESFLIGDRWKDVAAGQAAGCRTVWLDSGYDEPAPDPAADWTAGSLTEATAWLLAQPRRDAR